MVNSCTIAARSTVLNRLLGTMPCIFSNDDTTLRIITTARHYQQQALPLYANCQHTDYTQPRLFYHHCILTPMCAYGRTVMKAKLCLFIMPYLIQILLFGVKWFFPNLEKICRGCCHFAYFTHNSKWFLFRFSVANGFWSVIGLM